MTEQLSLAPRGSAEFSPCTIHVHCHDDGCEFRLYRRTLSRDIGGTRLLVTIGINPSSATAVDNDQTIRRCVGFARSLGFGRYAMGNLFDYRATDPRWLLYRPQPTSPKNDDALIGLARSAEMVVACWGHKSGRLGRLVDDRAAQVLAMLAPICDVHALRIMPSGHPGHPLYLPGDLQPVLYRAKEAAC